MRIRKRIRMGGGTSGDDQGGGGIGGGGYSTDAIVAIVS